MNKKIERASANESESEIKIVAQLAKAPIPNQVKTRMQPFLSAEEAVLLHKKMTSFIAENLSTAAVWQHQLWISQNDLFFDEIQKMFELRLYHQSTGDLGIRLKHISSSTFRAAADAQLILIGSDCPDLSAVHINLMFDELDRPEIDCVLTPARDGGYVALGIKRHTAQLFDNINWGTSEVLEQTLAQMKQLELCVNVLEALPDIDRPEDLMHLETVDGFQF